MWLNTDVWAKYGWNDQSKLRTVTAASYNMARRIMNYSSHLQFKSFGQQQATITEAGCRYLCVLTHWFVPSSFVHPKEMWAFNASLLHVSLVWILYMDVTCKVPKRTVCLWKVCSVWRTDCEICYCMWSFLLLFFVANILPLCHNRWTVGLRSSSLRF
jgi:hypothetical protein